MVTSKKSVAVVLRPLLAFGAIFLVSLNVFAQTGETTNQNVAPATEKAVVSPETKQSPETATHSQESFPVGRYLTGGLVGTVAGFGIGHVIVDRYPSTGLIYTIGEGAGALTALAGLMVMGNGARDRDLAGAFVQVVFGSIIFYGGAGVFLGFKVVEIIDIWVATPFVLNDRIKKAKQASLLSLEPMFIANKNGRNLEGGGLNLRWRF